MIASPRTEAGLIQNELAVETLGVVDLRRRRERPLAVSNSTSVTRPICTPLMRTGVPSVTPGAFGNLT